MYDYPSPRRGESALIYLTRIRRAIRPALSVNLAGSGSSSVTPAGTIIRAGSSAASFPWSSLAFGYSLTGAALTIYPGTLRIHGTGLYPVAEAALTLTGATEWAYLAHARNHSGTTISHASTEPQTTADELRVPLYKFTRLPSGSYTLARICNMGDINIDTPMR